MYCVRGLKMCDHTTREGKASGGKKPTGKLREEASASNFELSSDHPDYAQLIDKVKAILNQISAQSLKITIQKLKFLSNNNETKLKAVVKAIFEKSVNDKQKAEVYAKLCEQLSALRVDSSGSECVYFKTLLVEHCRQEVKICFSDEGSGSSQLWFEKMDAIGFTPPGSRAGLTLADATKDKKMGAVVFIGHLFRAEILDVYYMKALIEELFSFEDEYVWDCLCSLLLIIGHDMEAKKQDLALFLKKMQEVADKRQLSASAREKLELVFECRRNKWRQVTVVQSEHGYTPQQTAPVLGDGSRQDDAWVVDT